MSVPVVPRSIRQQPRCLAAPYSLMLRPATFSKTPRLCRSVTSCSSHLLHQRPRWGLPATPPVTGSAPPLLDEKIGVPGRASWFGGGRGVDPHSCSPFKQSSKPSWISNKNLCRETACRWQCNAVPLPAPPPRLTS